ncbi:DUF998 domain-containing protein [Pseudonocardia humida]|uniref:DUF998 domain-containing protein n=1 Tax=Pseudonocardia humida TaxID=2800819 RepID=A0ABT0ZXX9_9PSEU|nr:DUF998 domain-containing protein [Pseudonocardia humida]MCO1655576.1 DUF998 domain-containing protein [Pseudonocardia humida]
MNAPDDGGRNRETDTVNTPTIPTRAGTTSSPEELTADRVTKSLLGYGVIAGPIYVVASLTQALLREGFDLSRHAWSQLALGDAGWVQVTNFVVTGLMLIAAAVGLRRALRTGPAATWSPRLLAAFGLSMIAAGAFPVDPAGGFPVGAEQATTISATAAVHMLAGAVGFSCLAVALVLLARRLSGEGFGRLAATCRTVGPLFLLAFVAMASGLLGPAGIPTFVVAVLAVFAVLSVAFVHRYRQMPNTDGR